MASGQGEPGFNRARAELFEALGHPVRIRILQTLERGPTGFADLKKAVGIESSGHLAFHLGKLEGLLKAGQDGDYSLTDEGREALRVVSATRSEGEGGIRVRATRATPRNVVTVMLVVGLLLVASLAVYQQQQIGTLNRSIASQQAGSVVINGTRYSYLDVPLQSLNLPATIEFNGVTFNLTTSVLLSGPFSLTVTGAALQANQTGRPVTVRIYPLVAGVQVKFSDGQQESYSLTNPIWNQTGAGAAEVSFSLQPPAGPWFTQHTNPRAGIYWNPTTSSVELLVSMGT